MLINVPLAIYFQNTGGIEGALCLGVIAIFIAIVISYTSKSKGVAAAYSAYQLSLERLKSNPTDADLRQTTLQLGRAYGNLTRNKKANGL